MNIKFPETDVVSCVFSLKNSNCRYDGPKMNEFGYVGDGGMPEYEIRRVPIGSRK